MAGGMQRSSIAADQPGTHTNSKSKVNGNIRRTNYSFDSQVAVNSSSGVATPVKGVALQQRIRLPQLNDKQSVPSEKVKIDVPL